MTDQIALSVSQARKWTHPQSWMVNGYSSTQEVYYFYHTERIVHLAPGGWTLNAVDLLQLRWDGRADRECNYYIRYNDRQLYQGLWQPKPNETVTESFFYDGDLFVLNYRLLVRAEPPAGPFTP